MVDKIILELPADTVGGDILVSTETRERAEQAAAQAEATAAGMVVSGTIADDNLVLTKADSTTVVAGNVRGPKGNDGSNVLPTDEAIAQAVGTPGSETQAQLNATFVAFDVTADKADLADASPAFIAAAVAATAAGNNIIRVAPGVYSCSGLTVADILGCYIVGDGVKLTGAWVYPFSTDEFVNQSANATAAKGGRGVVAFEVDDGLPEHWTDLFPLTKELGITLGAAWHTGITAPWITEAHRHGWEFMFHMSENMDVRTLTPAQLDAEAQTGLDKIEAAIGTRENIGYVYPQHLRNDTTDRVLSKYFTRGRGIADVYIYPPNGGRTWLTTSLPLDPYMVGGVVAELVKEALRNVAKTDGRMVMFFHFNSVNKDTQSAALRELVPFIRSLGIQIVNPAQVWGERNIAIDPYDERESKWVLSGPAVRSTEAAYHGTHSFKITPPADAPGNVTVTNELVHVTSRPGMFSVYRASLRYKADVDVPVTSAGQGIGFLIGQNVRTLAGSYSSLPATTATPRFPKTGTIIPAGEWVRVNEAIYMDPATVRASLVASIQNIAPGSAPLYVDEIKLELLDYVSTITYKATLNGTGNVFVYTGVPNLARQTIQVTPIGPIAGRVSFSISANYLVIKSTDAADTAQVAITILPGASYADMTLPTTGA